MSFTHSYKLYKKLKKSRTSLEW